METVKRLKIGVLFGFHIYEGAHPAPFSFPIIRGMQAAALEKNINLMLACGVARRIGHSQQKPAWSEIDPETEAGGARIVAEQIRRTIGESNRFLRRLTVSFGIASMRGGQTDAVSLVEQADRALYQAKSQGKNCSVVFERGMLEPAHLEQSGD